MSSTPGATRRQARERALELLYEASAKSVEAPSVVDAQPTVPDAFAVDVANGVEEHRAEIDGLIGRFARGWSLERMPVVDRLLLEMGTYELLHRPDVPTGAVISEAVELAKQFSTEAGSSTSMIASSYMTRMALMFSTRKLAAAARAVGPTLSCS